MRKEFIVERQGKSFCLYAGLLDLAHQQGLKSIRTELVQIPSDANNRVAVCSATVVLESEGVERHFTGFGDAAPNNVAPAMQTCLLRMAETRAKARALRDAVNIGVASFEELGDDETYDGAPERGYSVGPSRNVRPERAATPVRVNAGAAPASRRTASDATAAGPAVTEARANPKAATPGGATETQTEAIRNLCRRSSMDPEAIALEKYSVNTLGALSQSQASEMIRELNALSNGRAAAAA